MFNDYLIPYLNKFINKKFFAPICEELSVFFAVKFLLQSLERNAQRTAKPVLLKK